MRGLVRTRSLAGAAALALALTACGGGDDPDPTAGEEQGQAAEGGSFSMYIGPPENPLIPGNTSETEGGQVVDAMFTGLVTYNNETSELEYNGVAESIESTDNTEWTVTLKDGWTFHDGTPVTASSFVDAWNYTAYSPNGQGNSYFFSDIAGYEDLQAETDDAGNVVAQPAAQEMTGLEVVDDLTFTVNLAEPFRQWPLKTGYTAFYPLPEAFYGNEETFGDKPIGNGPFMAATEFQPGQGITLAKYEEYGGEDEAQADEVEIRVYQEQSTAFRDVQAGNLDIVDSIPPDAIATAPEEFGDRFIEQPNATFYYMGYPLYDPRYQDPRVRQGLSMGVDREAITEAIFQGTREPAYSVIAPVIDGYRPDACEYCMYDPEAGKALLDAANFDYSQPIDLWFNAGAGHDQWVQAVGNQLQQNYGVDYNLKGDLQFAEYLPLGDQKGYTGPFRLGWAMDYPSPENFLAPLYATDAQPPNGSNSAFYSNPEFDRLLQEGNAAETNEEAVELYQAAEDVLLEDMPVMPIMYGVNQGVHTERVSNVVITPFSRVDLAGVTVTEP